MGVHTFIASLTTNINSYHHKGFTTAYAVQFDNTKMIQSHHYFSLTTEFCLSSVNMFAVESL